MHAPSTPTPRKTRLETLPPELFYLLRQQARTPDFASLVRTSRTMHQLATAVLYSTLELRARDPAHAAALLDQVTRVLSAKPHLRRHVRVLRLRLRLHAARYESEKAGNSMIREEVRDGAVGGQGLRRLLGLLSGADDDDDLGEDDDNDASRKSAVANLHSLEISEVVYPGAGSRGLVPPADLYDVLFLGGFSAKHNLRHLHVALDRRRGEGGGGGGGGGGGHQPLIAHVFGVSDSANTAKTTTETTTTRLPKLRSLGLRVTEPQCVIDPKITPLHRQRLIPRPNIVSLTLDRSVIPPASLATLLAATPNLKHLDLGLQWEAQPYYRRYFSSSSHQPPFDPFLDCGALGRALAQHVPARLETLRIRIGRWWMRERESSSSLSFPGAGGSCGPWEVGVHNVPFSNFTHAWGLRGNLGSSLRGFESLRTLEVAPEVLFGCSERGALRCRDALPGRALEHLCLSADLMIYRTWPWDLGVVARKVGDELAEEHFPALRTVTLHDLETMETEMEDGSSSSRVLRKRFEVDRTADRDDKARVKLRPVPVPVPVPGREGNDDGDNDGDDNDVFYHVAASRYGGAQSGLPWQQQRQQQRQQQQQQQLQALSQARATQSATEGRTSQE
ncbi:hypothetical protein F4778DRAFT_694878 [Xylariomycetidae sp. FL2044]|nr:hypothetical protein F4778DRAFT_694878 [Xylariomycetidae sp. FL2044]